jgi:hypothetical protein
LPGCDSLVIVIDTELEATRGAYLIGATTARGARRFFEIGVTTDGTGGHGGVKD